MNKAKLVVSGFLGTAMTIYADTTFGTPADPLTVVISFPILALMFSFAAWLVITIVPFMLGFTFFGPGRPPVQPTRYRNSLPYNSSNDPKRW